MKFFYSTFFLLLLLSSVVSAQKPDDTILDDFRLNADEKKDSVRNANPIILGKKNPTPKEIEEYIKEHEYIPKIDKYSQFYTKKKGGKLVCTCFSKSQDRLNGYFTYSRIRSSNARYKDCNFKMEYTVRESKKKSSIQIMMNTKQEEKNAWLWVGFSTDGQLMYSKDPKVRNEKEKWKYLPIKYSFEPCKSIRPVGEVNNVEVLRRSKTWFVVVNNDTVKRIPDTENYPYWDSDISYMGQQVVALDNVQTDLYNDEEATKKAQKEMAELVAGLLAMNGTYGVRAESCSKGSVGAFNLEVKFSPGGRLCTVKGLTDTPLELKVFNDPNQKTSLDTDPYKYYKIGGSDYSIKNMYFSQGVMHFKLTQVVEHLSGGTAMMNCMLVGTKVK